MNSSKARTRREQWCGCGKNKQLGELELSEAQKGAEGAEDGEREEIDEVVSKLVGAEA
jgi:hypothetical protein